MVSVPFAAGFAVATALSVEVTRRAVRARPRTGSGWFAVAMGGVSWWSAMKFGEVLVAGSDLAILFTAFHWLGVGAVSLGVLGFGLALRGREAVLTPPRVVALSIVPVLTVLVWMGDPRVVDLLFATTPGLSWLAPPLDRLGDIWSWYEWVSLLYHWGIVGLGSVFVVETAIERPKLDPSRMLLVVMVAVPWLVNVSYEFGVLPYAEFDPTVFGFVVTGIAGVATIDRFRLFDVPFARSQIVEQFRMPVLVIGRDDSLYDYNQQASDRLDIGPEDLDTDVREALADAPLAAATADEAFDTEDVTALDGTRVTVPADDQTRDRHYLINVAPVDGRQETNLGYTIQLTDVTEQYRRREEVRRERDLNEMIRRVLVKVSSREDIEQAVCDHLAATERYALAWIGERSAGDDLAIHTCATEAGLELPAPEYEPTETVKASGLAALETGAVQPIRAAETGDPKALYPRLFEHGIEAGAAVPLEHNDVPYGVMTVFTAREDAFDPEETALLADLGESLAFAMSAVRQRDTARGDRVTEVTLRVTDRSHYLVSLADALDLGENGRTVEVYEVDAVETAARDATSTGEDRHVHFLSVRGVQSETAVETLDGHDDIDAVTVLEDTEEVVSLRVIVQAPTVGSLVADAGGIVRRVTVTDGSLEVVTECSVRQDTNRLVDHVRAVYPDTSIRSVVTKAPDRTGASRSPIASLTPKQKRALQAAYRSGFFERPQRQTAEEIATLLDVSRSTFLKHVRSAENRLLEEVFSAEAEERPATEADGATTET